MPLTVIYIVGGYNGAGIGGGDGQSGGLIEISGGTVLATGGSGAAGIGGGGRYKGNGGTITISGGNIHAIGVSAIGGGSGITPGNGGIVTICGDASIIADGSCHAIGGGSLDNEYGCISLTIADTVTLVPNRTSGSFQEKIDYEKSLPDATTLSNHQVQFTTTASGNSGISYQWYESVDGESWSAIVGKNTNTAEITVDENCDGHKFRCAITNGWGNTVYTDYASVTVIYIVQQPQNKTLDSEGNVEFSIVSSSDVVTYQWQRSLDKGDTWNSIDGETNSLLNVIAGKSERGALYRCALVSTNGDTLYSDAVHIIYPLAFSQQPINKTSGIGEIATLTAKSDANYVYYQWQRQMSSNDEWTNIEGETHQSYYVQVTEENQCALYKCVISSPSGESISSNAVSASAVTVAFSAGDASGSMDSVIAPRGWPFELPECDFDSPAGWHFKAWSIGEVEYVQGESVVFSEDTTVVAIWEMNTYLVTVTSGIGGGSYAEGASVTITADEPRTGKQFEAWTGVDALTFTSGSKTSSTATFTMPASTVTLTATYKNATYTVTLNTNDGKINSGNVTSYTYGTETALPTDVTKDGFNFGGWYASSNFSGSAVTKITATETGNKTYYAKWTEIESSVDGDISGSAIKAKVIAPKGGLLNAVVYDASGRMVDVKTYTITADSAQQVKNTEIVVTKGYIYKVMLVNAETYVPLCPAWSRKAT